MFMLNGKVLILLSGIMLIDGYRSTVPLIKKVST